MCQGIVFFVFIMLGICLSSWITKLISQFLREFWLFIRYFPPHHVPFVLFFWSIEYNCYTIILYILIMFLMFLESFFSTFYLSVLQVESFTLLCLQHIFSRFTDSSVIVLLLISSSEVFTAETLFFISVCLLLSWLFDFIVCVSLLRLLFIISSMFPLYTWGLDLKYLLAI